MDEQRRLAYEINKLRRDYEIAFFNREDSKAEEIGRQLNTAKKEYDKFLKERGPIVESKTEFEPLSTDDSLRKIDEASQFKKDLGLLIERREKIYKHSMNDFEHISSKYKGTFVAKNPGNFRNLRTSLNEKEKSLTQYINEFSKTHDLNSVPGLVELVGIRDNGKDKKDIRGTTLVRPSFKQYDELTNELNILKEKPDANKDEIAEKEKKLKEQEKRLGKKWILKHKLDALLNEIQSLKAKLRDKNLTPEEREKIEKELKGKLAEFNTLSIEYKEVLGSIGEMIANTIEKEEYNKHGVKDLEKLKEKSAEKPSQEKSAEKHKDEKSADPSGTKTFSSGPAMSGGGTRATYGTPGSGGGVGYSSPNSSSKDEKAMTEKKSLFERINDWLDKREERKQEKENKKARKFIEKEEKRKKKEAKKKEHDESIEYIMHPEENKVLYEEPLQDDVVTQRLKFPLSKIDLEESEKGKLLPIDLKNGYFHHTVIEDGKMKYIATPLKNIDSSVDALYSKIDEVRRKFCPDGASKEEKLDIVKELLPKDVSDKERKKAIKFMNKSTDNIVGIRGFSKEERMKMMCELIDIEESGNYADFLNLIENAENIHHRLKTKDSQDLVKDIGKVESYVDSVRNALNPDTKSDKPRIKERNGDIPLTGEISYDKNLDPFSLAELIPDVELDDRLFGDEVENSQTEEATNKEFDYYAKLKFREETQRKNRLREYDKKSNYGNRSNKTKLPYNEGVHKQGNTKLPEKAVYKEIDVDI